MKKTATKESGQMMLIVIVLLSAVSLMLGALLMYTGTAIVSHRNSVNKEQALNIAEAGAEMAIWKLNNQIGYTGESNTAYGNGQYTIATTTINSTQKSVLVTAFVPNSSQATVSKKVGIMATTQNTSSASFYYGLSVGSGGLVMNNGSVVHGNVFSNGNISGSGTIDNDVIISGNGHSLGGVYVGGNALTYSCLSGASVNNLTYVTGGTHTCTVRGATSSQSDEISQQPLPIPQSQIDDWKTEASANVNNGDLTISGTQTKGPLKVVGNLTVNIGATLKLAGTMYVTGNVVFQNNASVQLDSSYGPAGGIILADGTITINNGNVFSGSGQTGSYVMLLSTSSANPAIDVQNNAQNVVLYAQNGGLTIHNNVSVTEATGNSITLQNNAQVQYSSGIVNILFSGGPGATWQRMSGTYQILQ